MTDREQRGQDPVAWAARMEAEGESGDPEVRVTSFDSPHLPTDRLAHEWPIPPDDRLAHLGHIEHPAEMYVIMTPVPNSMPAAADADEWIAAFGRVVADGNLPGGAGKTSRTMVVDTDPQGTAATPLGGPGLDLRRTCLTPVGEPSPKCTNPFNHQKGQA